MKIFYCHNSVTKIVVTICDLCNFIKKGVYTGFFYVEHFTILYFLERLRRTIDRKKSLASHNLTCGPGNSIIPPKAENFFEFLPH